MCVRVQTSSFCISGITRPVELKFDVQVDAAFSLISFSLKLIHGLGFYDDLNFLKNVYNRSEEIKNLWD